MNIRRRTAVIAAGTALALVALAACGSDSTSSSTSAAPTATAAATPTTTVATATAGTETAATETAATETSGSEAGTAASVDASKLPKKIRIGYQQVPNGDLVVKNLGYLEKAFPGVDIEWNLFASGGDVNQAVLAGSVDIGLVGSSPASRGLSSGIEYRVPWIFDVIGSAEALVAKAGITSIADLKGKTVATPFASTSHFSLLAALADAGVAESDVKIIDSEPDAIYAGWSAGQIDAAYVWNPNLAKLEADGGTVLIDSAQLAAKGKTTYDLAIVTNDFADKYPEAVNIWAAQEDKAVKLIKSDPDAAAAAIAIELNITPAEAKDQLGGLQFLDAAEQVSPDYLDGGLATNLFASAKFNLDQGKIDAVQPEDAYTAGVDDSFAKSVGS